MSSVCFIGIQNQECSKEQVIFHSMLTDLGYLCFFFLIQVVGKIFFLSVRILDAWE